MKTLLVKLFVLAVSVSLVFAPVAGTISHAQTAMPPKSYLMLISFYSDQINANNLTYTKNSIAPVFNTSPYHGIAISSVRYDSQLGTGNIDWMANTGITKQIWPWIFINRIMGYDPNNPPANPKPHFSCIKGMALTDQCNALTDFWHILRQSLAMAKKLGSPGIVFDPEPYNNYNLYGMQYLMNVMGLTETQLIAQLKNVGLRMHDVIYYTMPNCIVWTLFNPVYERWPRPVTYIMMGFLERAAQFHSNVKVVAGGEVGLGYCSKDFATLQQKVTTRNTKFAPFLTKYPNLRIGGTISPWVSTTQKTGWVTQGECGSSEFKTINDFQPAFQHLFSQFWYVWIYAAGAANYDPFKASVTSQVNPILSAALNQATVPTAPR